MTRCQDYLDTMKNNCDPSCKEPTKKRMVRSTPKSTDLASEQTDFLRRVGWCGDGVWVLGGDYATQGKHTLDVTHLNVILWSGP